MEDGMTFFFDSYALIEIYKANPNYNKYADVNVITTYFNLLEAYYNIRKTKTTEESEDFFKTIKKLCINLKFEWIKKVTDFRLKNTERELSYVDCLGYVIAKEMNIKFLTGDKEFKAMDNVEFVK